MKVLVIGDLHGLNIWKKLIEENPSDHIVFLGDYVDSFIAPDDDILNNLKEIINFKKNNMEKVTLLLGNHDIQYIYKEGNQCSGYRPSMFTSLSTLFKENIKLFQIVKKIGEYYFSHGGINQSWIDYNKHFCRVYNFSFDNFEILNDIFHNSSDREVLFQCGPGGGGYCLVDGPLWCRNPTSYANVFQVVGHTPVKKITHIGNNAFCDNLEYGDCKPLIIEIYE